jgi:hypothetical protein
MKFRFGRLKHTSLSELLWIFFFFFCWDTAGVLSVAEESSPQFLLFLGFTFNGAVDRPDLDEGAPAL